LSCGKNAKWWQKSPNVPEGLPFFSLFSTNYCGTSAAFFFGMQAFMTLRPFASIVARSRKIATATAVGMPKVARPRSGKVLVADMDTRTAEYYFEDGLRKVKPYSQTFYANVKQRWINRTIPDVFASEMPRRCTKSMIVRQTNHIMGSITSHVALTSANMLGIGHETRRHSRERQGRIPRLCAKGRRTTTLHELPSSR
jgi:hypothetical protein